MKRFSEIDYSFENKKFKDRSKNDIYSLIKENISFDIKPLNINESIDIDNIMVNISDTSELVDKINKYIIEKVNNEKIKVLKSIKASIATGTLSIKKINEDIESCECSETCPIEYTETENKEDKDNLFDDQTDFDDDLDIVEDSEYVTTEDDSDIDLEDIADDIINAQNDEDDEIIESLSWGKVFDKFNIPENKRTNLTISKIYETINNKKNENIELDNDIVTINSNDLKTNSIFLILNGDFPEIQSIMYPRDMIDMIDMNKTYVLITPESYKNLDNTLKYRVPSFNVSKEIIDNPAVFNRLNLVKYEE